MTTEAPAARPTRQLFIGSHALADGFRLIGFETIVDPEPSQVNRILRDLHRGRESAFVVFDDAIMDWEMPMLAQLRREGGRIVMISLPPLEAHPPRLSSDVANRLEKLFGTGNLSPGEST